jgi:hypothetical protein
MADIEVKPGVEFKIRAIRWDAGWEFDCPAAIISPVLYTSEDGSSFEHLIESFMIDCCIDGKMPSHDPKFWEWRGWDMPYLRRKYYRKNTQRADVLVRFVLDEDGELSWEERSI